MKMETNILYNRDNAEVLRSLPDNCIDMILEDMPYNVTNADYEYAVDLEAYWVERLRVLKPNGVVVLTAIQPFATDLIMSNRKMFKYDLIWVKNKLTNFVNAKHQPMRNHELVCVFYTRAPTYNAQKRKVKYPNRTFTHTNDSTKIYAIKQDKYTYKVGELGAPVSVLDIDFETRFFNSGKNRKKNHPAQKPLNLFRYLICTYTNPGDIVFDGYVGGGTTAKACIKENRRYICCEWNANYYQMALREIEEMKREPELELLKSEK